MKTFLHHLKAGKDQPNEHRPVRAHDLHPGTEQPATTHADAIARAVAGYGPDAVADLALPRTDPSSGLILPPEPIKAWKYASSMKVVDGRCRFVPISAGSAREYGVDDTSVCGKCARPPGQYCKCGFYALRDEVWPNPWNPIVLEVELFGTVHVHDRGYRAERQRVMRASVYLGCKATLYRRDEEPQRCGEPPTFVVESTDTPLCARHALEQRHRFAELNVNELEASSQGDTEVRFIRPSREDAASPVTWVNGGIVHHRPGRVIVPGGTTINHFG